MWTFFQNNIDPDTTNKILEAMKSEAEPPKWYHGTKWYQHEKGAKWYHLEKKPMETRPTK